jgi:hypothetical protein
VRPVAVTVALIGFGWAVVTAADARHQPPEARTYTQVFVQTVEPEQEDHFATPYADSLIDWVEHDRQTDCLWTLLERSGVELTLDVVMAAGIWSDALGGACLMIGEDDE